MKTGHYYLMPTLVGPLGSTLAGVKAGKTDQEAFGRIRAYEQPGVQYTMSVWYGVLTDIKFLEDKFKNKFEHANMRRKFKTVCTEVFIGDHAEFCQAVDDIIQEYRLDVKFFTSGYSITNKTEHGIFLANNSKPILSFQKDEPRKYSFLGDSNFNIWA